MKRILCSTLLAALFFAATAGIASAQEAPRLQVSLGTTALNPGDVVPLPDTAVADTSEPVVLTIANEGDAPLVLSSWDPPALSGDGEFMFFLDTSQTADSVDPGGRTSLEVIFFPSEPGKAEATLTISTNDPEVPQFALTLSGKALETSE